MKMTRKPARALILVFLAIQYMTLSTVQAFAATQADPPALRLPEAGGKTKTDDNRLTIDYSHMDQGYMMVRAVKCDRKMKLTVELGADQLHYEINGDGRYETIPLQFGSGSYRVSLWIQLKKSGSKYERSGSIRLKCSMKDETSCFLYPNQYVNYDADTPLVAEARRICRDLNHPEDKVEAIYQYVIKHIHYDYIKENTINAGNIKDLLPDIKTAWESGFGICQDQNAVMCAMLRSQGIPAKLAIGNTAIGWHAWVVVSVGGKNIPYDPTNPGRSAESYRAERVY